MTVLAYPVDGKLAKVTGIEPAHAGLESAALPLSYTPMLNNCYLEGVNV